MIKGILFSLMAGILICIQSVFNTRLSEKTGLWGTNVLVHGSGLIVALLILLFTGDGYFKNIATANKWYLLGGTLGVMIVFSVMKGISLLGTTFSVALVLSAQLLSAAAVDTFGLFGTEPRPFDLYKVFGFFLMLTGMILFKWKD
ncbi:Hypothetical protein LUCI_0460 [Lucifera butyrica]|uniref:Uncharacterized protein n=1 Tax=Lucifera butyrica TaxID=1351585 RepID=A0A498R4Y9_9FIRM|nr:DMT family transporter [Lucifera butyrica]VBB05253.1 Hypothetical protein LUCI_0460 [Lucifera butyrica]